jgi:hypothetical protein
MASQTCLYQLQNKKRVKVTMERCSFRNWIKPAETKELRSRTRSKEKQKEGQGDTGGEREGDHYRVQKRCSTNKS